MKKEDVEKYVNRWKEVEKIEAEELRNMDMETRFEITAALFDPDPNFPNDELFREQKQKEIEEVRQTWILLKKRLGHGQKK